MHPINKKKRFVLFQHELRPCLGRHFTTKRRRLSLLVLLLLLLAGILLFVCRSVYRAGELMTINSAEVAPPPSMLMLPFRDLCLSAAAAQRRAVTDAKHSTNRSTVAPRHLNGSSVHSSPIERLMKRYRHLPADGGVAGQRWSGATGLPIPAVRTGRILKVKFLTLSTKADDFLQASTTAATLAGVPLEVVGVGWRWFIFTRRLHLFKSFLDHAKLSNKDVVVGMDADSMFSGEDVYESLTAFVASTAADAAEHETFAVRDIRLGKRLPPVLFSAEYNCMHIQAYPAKNMCASAYDAVDQSMARWAQGIGVSLPSEHCGLNPLRYLNAGFFVARVWALRALMAAMQAFMKSHRFYNGEEWWCDQSVLASLYLQLRWWEVTSGALDHAVPRALPPSVTELSPFPPLVLPSPYRGPHGLRPGMMGLDTSGRFSLVVSMEMEPQGVMRLGRAIINEKVTPEAALTRYLQANREPRVEQTGSGLVRSSHRLELVPRASVDCASAPASQPAECLYRAAVLGMPDRSAVAPLVWHFAGRYKSQLLTRFRTLFSWYTPMLWSAVARAEVLTLLADAPPTRRWYINDSTDLPFEHVRPALNPYAAVHDVTFLQLCAMTDPVASRFREEA